MVMVPLSEEFLPEKAKEILNSRFGHDTLIALASVEDNIPYVRTVNSYYEDGCFYIITHALSNKMRQFGKNPYAAISGDWFTAHGHAVNLGCFADTNNRTIAQKLEKVFCQWLDNGHTDLSDPHTCILCIQLTDGVLFSNGTRFDLKFPVAEDTDILT